MTYAAGCAAGYQAGVDAERRRVVDLMRRRGAEIRELVRQIRSATAADPDRRQSVEDLARRKLESAIVWERAADLVAGGLTLEQSAHQAVIAGLMGEAELADGDQ